MRWFGPVWIALTVAIVRGVGGRAGSDPNAPEGSETSDKSHFDMARGWGAYLVVLPLRSSGFPTGLASRQENIHSHPLHTRLNRGNFAGAEI
jgi:hypothetical protein